MATATAPVRKQKPKMEKWQVLEGKHVDRVTKDGDFVLQEERDEAGNQLKRSYEMRMYKEGDILETDKDMNLYNRVGSIRFQKIQVDENSHVWNSAKESIEEFAARMRAVSTPTAEQK